MVVEYPDTAELQLSSEQVPRNKPIASLTRRISGL